jgi:hypothetical protein
MRSSSKSRAAEVISCDNASLEIDRVGRRVEKRVAFDGYVLGRVDPDICLGRRSGTLERVVFYRRSAVAGSLVDGPETRRRGERGALIVTLLASIVTVAEPKFIPLRTAPFCVT